MNPTRFLRPRRASGTLLLETVLLLACAAPADAQFRLQVRRREQVELPAGVEVFTRGPVHEAFAKPITLDPVPGLMSRIPPPAPVNEVPPSDAPIFIHGTAAWIPGYWAWDDPENEYVWVSGIWRVPPPRASWVPGYWSATGDGYRWTPGFWLTDEDNEIEYYWDPPANLDDGPPGDPPRPDVIWVPGAWYSEQTYEWAAEPGADVERRDGFFWRPGYWLRARPEWTWIPAHYIWTGRGNVFVDGHWDHALERRGLLFAPVRLDLTTLGAADFRYVPAYVIPSEILTTHLFTRPRYVHYYFGDYYAPRYARRGIFPWYETEYIGYDPLFISFRWRHRERPDWLEGLRRDYAHRRAVVAARPPVTFRSQLERVRTVAAAERDEYVLARPVRQLTTLDRGRVRLQELDPDRRSVLERQGQALRDLVGQRTRWEAADGGTRRDAGATAQPQPSPTDPGRRAVSRGAPAERVTLPQAPVSGRQQAAEPDTPAEPAPEPESSRPRKIRRVQRGGG